MKPTNTVAKLFSSVSTLAVVAGAIAFNGVAWGQGVQVVAWGSNWDGQCRGTDDRGCPINSETADGTVPVQINGVTLTGVSAIACGGDRTIALKNGAVLAWGWCDYNMCNIPADAQSGVSAIAGGEMSSIALKNGAVLGWGYNMFDEIIIPVSAQSGVSAIACGGYHSIALKNGEVLAWGAGTTNQINGGSRNVEYGQCIIPATAQNGVTAIAGGHYHTIALKDGAVLAWGNNDSGQCTIPAAAQSGVSAIAGGGFHTIAIKNGAVLAWGANGQGQCNIPSSANSGVSAIAGGDLVSVALKNGAVLAWGYKAEVQCNIPVAAQSGVFAIAGGDGHIIALKDLNDIDGDGIPNATDNCRSVSNPTQADCDVNGVGDACELDCNHNGIADVCEILSGAVTDINGNNIPDSCDVVSGLLKDCNHNGIADVCEILSGAVTDQNLNGIPDTCEVSSVSRVLPISGPSTGGTAVRIIGTNFFSALPVSVTFGGAPATDVVVVSLTEITAVTPAGSPGDTFVAVNGASAEAFYYRPSCDGDLDNNGTIDSSDLGLLLINMGDCSSSLITQQQQEPMIFPMPEAAKPVAVK